MMVTGHLFVSAWNFEPSVIAGCLALLGGYLYLVRFRRNIRTFWFGLGVLCLLVALVSPLDTLGDTYLFSAHMIQHLILVLIVPPLLLLGLPPKLLARTFRRWPWLGRVERALANPLLAWIVGIGPVWIWHVPYLYEATLESEAVHIGEHLMFLVTAAIFWWPVLAQPLERRLHPLPAMAYLFAAGISSSILGIILTFAQEGIYPSYVRPLAPPELVQHLRTEWGLTPGVDQQVGGLFMWVLGSLVYLLGVFTTMARWFRSQEEETYQEMLGQVTGAPAGSLRSGAIATPGEEI